MAVFRPLQSVRQFTTRIVVNEQFVRQRILGDKEALIKRLKRGGRFRFTRPPKNAAVVIPLCEMDGRLSILFTLRSPHLYNHGGQVSFPGGKVDDTDASRSHTAVRECVEELGINRDKIDVWVELQEFPDRTRTFCITPVLCFINDLELEELKPSEEEVGDIFTTPITSLIHPSNQGYTSFRNGWTFPVFPNCKHQVWGMTAVMTEVLLANAFSEFYKMKLRLPDKKRKPFEKWL
ncbi:mitochondrial coenzyme A diphosphatase NUDT8-like [Clytia hemisphaerica]|uniref:Nudix hydrolase domain-containing protein n=1 Tax=Clytia hemisphaerica TaxID=252671 RepID=A0A7M5V0F1_9CNID